MGEWRRLVSAQMSISPIIPAAQWCLMFSLFFTVNQVFFQCKHPYPLFLSDNLISGWRYNPQTEVMSSRLPRVREVLVASHILLRTERCLSKPQVQFLVCSPWGWKICHGSTLTASLVAVVTLFWQDSDYCWAFNWLGVFCSQCAAARSSGVLVGDFPPNIAWCSLGKWSRALHTANPSEVHKLSLRGLRPVTEWQRFIFVMAWSVFPTVLLNTWQLLFACVTLWVWIFFCLFHSW